MKKTMFKRIFAGIAAMFMMCLFLPIGFTGTDFKPSLETAAESGNGWTLENGVLTVSEGINIRDGQFYYDSSIKKVIIGDNCTVNTCAFSDCASLTNVTFGDSCTVNMYAFEECTSLTNVTFGDSCTIGYKAFWGCDKIKAVVFTGKSIDSVNVDFHNPAIICNMNGWYKCNKQHTFNTNHTCTICGYECDKQHKYDTNHKCTICGYECKHIKSCDTNHKCKVCGYECKHAEFDEKFNCTICGYFDKAAVEAEIKANEERNAYLKSLLNEQETQSENESDNNTASTISTGNPLILLFGGIAVIIGSVAAAIIVKRMKKA